MNGMQPQRFDCIRSLQHITAARAAARIPICRCGDAVHKLIPVSFRSIRTRAMLVPGQLVFLSSLITTSRSLPTTGCSRTPSNPGAFTVIVCCPALKSVNMKRPSASALVLVLARLCMPPTVFEAVIDILGAATGMPSLPTTLPSSLWRPRLINRSTLFSVSLPETCSPVSE